MRMALILQGSSRVCITAGVSLTVTIRLNHRGPSSRTAACAYRCPAMQVAAAIVVTLHRGREASALAAAFNVLSLPAVVYLPPNCIAAVADECR